jgi:hypothetical protein
MRYLIVLLALSAAAAWSQRPHAFVANGSFEQPMIAWSLTPGTEVVSDRPHSGQKCLRVTPDPNNKTDSIGSGSVELVGLQAFHTYTVVGWARCEGVTPDQTGTGYGYMAVYQYDATQRMIAGGDFANLKGTQDWQRYKQTFNAY